MELKRFQQQGRFGLSVLSHGGERAAKPILDEGLIARVGDNVLDFFAWQNAAAERKPEISIEMLFSTHASFARPLCGRVITVVKIAPDALQTREEPHQGTAKPLTIA